MRSFKLEHMSMQSKFSPYLVFSTDNIISKRYPNYFSFDNSSPDDIIRKRLKAYYHERLFTFLVITSAAVIDIFGNLLKPFLFDAGLALIGYL